LLVVGEEAEFREAEFQTFLVQNTHDDALAVGGGEAGDAQVDHFAADLGLDAAVLGDALFGDGHVALDFEAGNDGGLEALGWTLDFVEDAVDAVADAKAFGEGFEVDVGGAGAEGFDNDGVDEFDDGGVGVDFGAVVGVHGGLEGADLDFAFGDVLDHLADVVVGDAIEFVERGFDAFFGGDFDFQFGVEEMVEAVDGVEVGGVGDGDAEGVAVAVDGDAAVALGDVSRDGGDDGVVEFEFGEVDDFDAEMGGFGVGDVAGGNGLALDEQ